MFVHASSIQKQFEYLRSLGIDINPLYKQIGIAKDEVFNSHKTFDFEQYKSVLDFALRQTSNPNYGLDFGTQPQLGGTVGMMCASCANLKEAFVQGCKFMKVQGDFAEIKFVDDDHYPKLVYTPMQSWDLESPQTAKLEVDAMFSFLNTILKINSNDTIKAHQINFSCKQPDETDKYIEVFGLTPNFECDDNEIIFRNSSLLIPMKAFNPETFNLLNNHLQSRLTQLNRDETIADKVKRILHTSFKYEFPDIESVAGKLNLSARTLQRKLSE